MFNGKVLKVVGLSGVSLVWLSASAACCRCDGSTSLHSALIISASFVISVTHTCPPFNSIQSALLALNVENGIQTSLSWTHTIRECCKLKGHFCVWLLWKQRVLDTLQHRIVQRNASCSLFMLHTKYLFMVECCWEWIQESHCLLLAVVWWYGSRYLPDGSRVNRLWLGSEMYQGVTSQKGLVAIGLI